MKSHRVLVFTGLSLIVCLFAACGGKGSGQMPTQPLTITSSAPLQGSVGVHYSFLLQASGGKGPYTWSISTGSLPPGVTLNPTEGLVSGLPTMLGMFPFTAQVTDSANSTASANFTINIGGSLLVTCPMTSCPAGNMVLNPGTPGMPYSATLMVSGGVAPYTWCVLDSNGNCDASQSELPPGLSLTTDSSDNGIISGTPTTPGTPAHFNIQAKDSETPAAAGSISLTLTIFAIGTTMLPNGQTFIPYNQTATAVGGAGPYTWCVLDSGGMCDANQTELPPGLTLNSITCVRNRNPSCNISGTPSQTGTFPFALQATDGENPPAVATQMLSITVTAAVSNSLLNGNYLLAINGYKNGAAFVMAGSFIADGNGNITGGKLDVNYGQGEPNDPNQCHGNPNCPVAERIQASGSSYDLSAGNGLGNMTIETLDNSNNQHTYKFTMAVSGNACAASVSLSECGRLIVRDPNDPNTYGSGILKVQDSQFFSVSSFFPGNFALMVTGTDPNGGRYAAAGALGMNPNTLVDIDCNGNGWMLAGCPLDTDDNGKHGRAPAMVPGTFASEVDSGTGRGNFVNIGFPNDPNGYCVGGLSHPTCGYAYYIINKQELLLISGDPVSKPANLTLWQAYRQRSFGTGWTLQQLSGKTVAELTGLSGGSSGVTAGVLNGDGAGNATFSYDQNAGGTLSHQTSVPGTYALGTNGGSTGNFVLSGFGQSGLDGASVYLYTGNKGYLVGADANVTSGVFEAQSGSSFTNASIIGSLEGGTAWPAVSGATNSVEWMFADGVSNITGKQYTSNPIGGPTDLTLTYQVDSIGRAVINQNGQPFGFMYVIGPTKFVFVPVGNDPALSIFISGQPD